MPGHVYDIRGTHGSGKSHIVHSLLKAYPHIPIVGTGKGGIAGYRIQAIATMVVGPYKSVCGGCDQIRTQQEVCDRVREYRDRPGIRRVVLEGILVGHTFKRYHELALELGLYTFLFLDTPLAVCLDRIRARRLAKGNTKPLDPTHTKADHHRVHTVLPAKFREAGHAVHILPWEDSVAAARRLMGIPT